MLLCVLVAPRPVLRSRGVRAGLALLPALAALAALGCAGDDAEPTGLTEVERPVIVFTRSASDSSTLGAQIVAVRADGTGPRVLTDTDHNWDPRWSPDGARIAFVSARTGAAELYVMRDDGTDVRRLTTGGAVTQGAAWSPDGRRIAVVTTYQEVAAGGDAVVNLEVEVVGADGTGRTRLTTGPARDINPAWSPDGARIAFSSERSGRLELYTMRPDGSDVRRLTTASGTAGGGGFFPAWSPDGRRVAFASSREGNQELYVVNADGTGEVRLTNHPARDNQPTWSPDGTRLLFWSTRDGGPPQIYVMNADGSDARRLVTSATADRSASWRR
jgi:Tol biopolymer transport system component